MMNVRKYTDEDYTTLCHWWGQHGMNKMPKNTLSDTGFIVDELCAGFLYTTNSNVCFFDHFISNKSANKEERNKALDELTQTLIEACGTKLITVCSKIPAIIERSKRFGFVICEGNYKIGFRT